LPGIAESIRKRVRVAPDRTGVRTAIALQATRPPKLFDEAGEMRIMHRFFASLFLSSLESNMYAVIKTGGKQYRVAAGEKLKIEQIPAEVGAEDYP
jgi:hypothetical protein